MKGSTIYRRCWHEWASLLYLQPQYILFRLMVNFKIFKLNVCASHTTTSCLPQNWRTHWLRLFFEKNTTRIDRKIVELECIIKEKDDRIALNKGPIISPTRKGGPKKKSPRVLQFLISGTRILLCQTSICTLVSLFWIPYQRKGGRNCLEEGSYTFSHKKRRTEEA